MRRLLRGRADRPDHAALSAILERSSPKAVVGNITAPTLLVQGEKDTLFGLDQADANARAIAANGTTVAVTWYNGGHDGGSPDAATEARITEWFQHYLAGTGPVPANSFRYTVDGPISDTGRARSRTLRSPSTRDWRPVAAPTGSPSRSPATRSSWSTRRARRRPASPRLPGLSGLASTALSTFAGGLPGQTARFASAPFGDADGDHRHPADHRHGVAGSRVAATPPPSAADDGAVLFGSTVQGVRGRHPHAGRRRGGTHPADEPARRRQPRSP